MRRIVTNKVRGIADIGEIWNTSHVGILWEGSKNKSVIIKNNNGDYIGMKNNGSLSIEAAYWHPTKRDYVNHSINVMQAEAFVFDTAKELLTWFAE